MTRQEIKDVRTTLKKFPDQREFLKSLYPEAFKSESVTAMVVVKLKQQIESLTDSVDYLYLEFWYKHTVVKDDKKKVIEEFIGILKTGYSSTGSTIVYKREIEPDFEMIGNNGGFRFTRYGKL